MNYCNGLSDNDKKEIYEDICASYQADIVPEKEFRQKLGELGYNATDIEELVRFYRPEPDDSNGEPD